MKILLDLQGLQSESRSRGIGRLTRMLALAMIAGTDRHRFHVLLSEDLDADLDGVVAAFSAVLPPGRIHTIGPYGRVAEHVAGSAWRARAAALLREAKIATLRPDLVHVGSLFEGYVDDAVLSIGRMRAEHRTAVTLYDLIPLADPERYLADPLPAQFYLRHVLDLKRADLLLSISEHTKDEASRLLGIPPDRIAVVYAGVSPAFRPLGLGPEQEAGLRRRFGIEEPFLLFVGATDPRKNVSTFLEGFSRLPPRLRAGRAIVFAGKLSEDERLAVLASGRHWGIPDGQVVFTGFVEDPDLVALYNLCEAMIFPSSHEGFGLPPAEAMACGTPVLAADRTSLPEVLGRSDCLFDPFDAGSLAGRLERVLTDPDWRAELSDWGLRRAPRFTWAEAGRRALAAFDALPARPEPEPPAAGPGFRRRPRMAFVSPLPAEPSGVADYSAELLRELLVHYEIDCIHPEAKTEDGWIAANCGLRTIAWFEDHAADYDRILYSIGNSTFHAHMFGLLVLHPGTVILHDAFLSDLAVDLARLPAQPGRDFLAELYRSHGPTGLRTMAEQGAAAVASRLPMSGIVFRNARGVILHSRFAADIAVAAFGPEVADEIGIVPHLRALPTADRREEARTLLGFEPDDVVVCSFGIMHARKMSGTVADAFLRSGLAASGRGRLVFVGSESGPIGATIRARLATMATPPDVRFTERVDAEAYGLHLQAADIAVQLRAESRGETSGAVLDAMAQGLAVIVSDFGSASEIRADAVIKVPAGVTAAALADHLDALWRDQEARAALGRRARDEIRRSYRPVVVAAGIAALVERFAADSGRTREATLLGALADIQAEVVPGADDLDWLARQTRALYPAPRLRQILCDVSAIAETDLETGIQRVVRAALDRLIAAPPPGFRIEPVVISGEGLVYARRFVEDRLGLPLGGLPQAPVETGPGDHYLCLDWIPDRLPVIEPWLARFRRTGGTVTAVIYDLLPLEQPDWFPDWLPAVDRRWLDVLVRRADRLACISAATADSVARLAGPALATRAGPLALGVFHLGHDLAATRPGTALPAAGRPSAGTPSSNDARLAAVLSRPAFLMVGTVEPRKGHGQVLDGFEALWREGVDVSLVIAGKAGWMVDALAARIRGSREFGTRLAWLPDAGDEVLERLYGSAAALVAASFGEGFGLPLVEAAGHDLPVIARDLPVFREVAGDHATYFRGDAPADLARAVRDWLSLRESGGVPSSTGMARLTWAESTEALTAVMLGERVYRVLDPAGSDPGRSGAEVRP